MNGPRTRRIVFAFDERSLEPIEKLREQGRLTAAIDALHRDQTGLAKALADIVQCCQGYAWITEGRGPYAWDDDRYREAIGHCLTEIEQMALKALRESGTLAHQYCCGRQG